MGEYAFAMKDITMSVNPVLAASPASIKIYPNPASETLNVDLSACLSGKTSNTMLVVTDMKGNVMLKQNNNKSMLQKISTAEFSNGIYTIILYSGKEVIAREKFVVTH
jgi:hypothetical protein